MDGAKANGLKSAVEPNATAQRVGGRGGPAEKREA